MERLQKVIAASGICSRRKAEEYILDGRVKVDGVVVTELGTKVKQGASIEVDNKLIQRENKVYYVLYKPKKVLSSVSDDRDRETVVEFIPGEERIFPIGRLDYDTTGVLLLTNDGEFANEMIHPRYHIPKIYSVIIRGILETEHIKQLEKGIELDEVMTLPTKIKVTNKDFKKNQTTLEIKIWEGRNRQIRRMFEQLGYEVTRLHRKQFAFITTGSLNPGEYRLLKPFEVKQLRKMANEKE